MAIGSGRLTVSKLIGRETIPAVSNRGLSVASSRVLSLAIAMSLALWVSSCGFLGVDGIDSAPSIHDVVGAETFSLTTTTQNQMTVVFQQSPPVWAEDINAILLSLEQWRGLPFRTDLAVTFLSEPDSDLNGWYNSETKALVVNLQGSEALGRGTLLHELHHALQDQHFDLYNLHRQTQEEPDVDKAVTAMIEGEAMLAVSELLNYDFLAHAQLPTDRPISDDFFEKIFLYGAGLQFIQAIRDEGGWPAVNAMFQDPPRATTLIFHPERYLAGFRESEPIEIVTPLGETLISQTVQGEYELQRLFAQAPDTRGLLSLVSEQYVADALGLIQTTQGQTQHRWVIQLQTPDAAKRLRAALETVLKKRMESGPTVLVTVAGSQLIAAW